MASKRKKKTKVEFIPGGLRDIAIMVRVSASEHEEFQRRAEEMGLSLSSWVRMTLREELMKDG